MTFIFCSLVCAKCDSPFILGERISLCLYLCLYQFVSNFLLNLSCSSFSTAASYKFYANKIAQIYNIDCSPVFCISISVALLCSAA